MLGTEQVLDWCWVCFQLVIDDSVLLGGTQSLPKKLGKVRIDVVLDVQLV